MDLTSCLPIHASPTESSEEDPNSISDIRRWLCSCSESKEYSLNDNGKGGGYHNCRIYYEGARVANKIIDKQEAICKEKLQNNFL